MTASTSRRLVLVPRARTTTTAAASESALRRYRLARLRVEDPQARRRSPERFAHLKRAYD